ncbi:unnamed protein product [Soboliphyme baturini]|uniref:DUF3456 domain-containing protein n=1 Tax=Soboliphyme baturini TaxID=241478 RepID=A0A183IY96_9BILA|nr:unnamed protein product [Soboliphyme baturini]
MPYPVRVHTSTSNASLADEYHAVKQLTLGFSVDYQKSNSSLRRISSAIKHQSSKASDICQAVDELELETLQHSSKNDKANEIRSKNLDEIHAVLEYTAEHEALMAFYYLDEKNQVKITEIYDADDEQGEKLFA